jgi:hypothetical protein
MQSRSRVARFTRIARKDTAVVTNELLVAAPGVGRRIVIDQFYFNISVAGTVEAFFNTTGWTDADGAFGGSFGINGGFVESQLEVEGGDNQPLSWTTTGTSPTIYLVVVYHIETLLGA